MNHALLNRARAAEFLGISLSEFKRREKSGVYKPTLINEKGWRMYAPDYLNKLKNGEPLVKRSGAARKIASTTEQAAASEPAPNYSKRGAIYEPEVAAKIFAELDNGMSGREIVQKLLVHPDVVSSVYEAWTRLAAMEGGGMHVSGRIMDIINTLQLPGDFPIQNAEGLLANLREASELTPLCRKCGKRPRQLCTVCAQPEDSGFALTLPAPVKVSTTRATTPPRRT